MLRAVFRSSYLRNISNDSSCFVNRFLSSNSVIQNHMVAAENNNIELKQKSEVPKKLLESIQKNLILIEKNVTMIKKKMSRITSVKEVDDTKEFHTQLYIQLEPECYSAAHEVLTTAYSKHILLNDKDYELLFLLSSKTSSKFTYRSLRRVVVDNYEMLRTKDKLSERSLSALLISDSAWGLGLAFWEKFEIFEDKNFELNEKLLSACIGNFADSPLTDATKSMMMLYNLYKDKKEAKGWNTLDAKTYRHILLRYIRRQNRSLTDKHRFPNIFECYAGVVKEMNENNIRYIPTIPALFDAAIKSQDIIMIDTLLGFHLNLLIGSENNFHIGRSTNLLGIAAAQGRPDLSRVALQWKDNIGARIGHIEYSLWLISTAKKLDYVDVIDVIVEAEKDGIDLRSHRLYMLLMDVLFKQYGTDYDSVNAVECIENYLQYLQKDDIPIPRFVHDLLIAAYAQVRRVDDAYAMFDQLPDKDILSFNMLVYVHAHFKNADPTKILNIFQEMEQEGLSPDGVSFTHLFHSMASSRNFDALHEILDYLESLDDDNNNSTMEKVRPESFALFRLSQKLESLKEEELFARIQQHLPEITKDHIDFSNDKDDGTKGVKNFLNTTLYR